MTPRTAHGGAFIVRLTRSYDPWIRTAWVEGQRTPSPTRVRLSRFLAQHAGQRLDRDVDFHVGPRVVGFRVVVLPGREAAMTRLCTNMPRTPFSCDRVSRLYRFRWQIELCFKEWKSYANRHQFDTAHAHIAEGLIWASLCAAILKRFLAHAAQRVGGTARSTRRVAMCAHPILDALVAALRLGVGLRGTLRRGLAYLLANARRANPDRDRRTGRLRAGLRLLQTASVITYEPLLCARRPTRPGVYSFSMVCNGVTPLMVRKEGYRVVAVLVMRTRVGNWGRPSVQTPRSQAQQPGPIEDVGRIVRRCATDIDREFLAARDCKGTERYVSVGVHIREGIARYPM